MKLKFLFIILFINLVAQIPSCHSIDLTPEEKIALGQEIWKNETGQKEEFLIFWNPKEEFISLGIGHFIWYPANAKKLFTQTFPSLLSLFQENGIQFPLWLNEAHQTGAPWQSKDDFYSNKEQEDIRIEDLKNLLLNTIDIQTDFIIKRLYNNWPKILQHAHPDKAIFVKKNFNQLTQTLQGIFALIDYLNFKGEGINSTERYNNKGWGLLQVLEEMPDPDTIQPEQTVSEFANAAIRVLLRRIFNAPINKQHESKWRKGWINRIKKYPSFNN